MISAYVDAYRALDDSAYLESAIKSAQFLSENQIKSDGSMFHNYKNGRSTIDGFAEDYAHTTSAFIDLYEVTLNEEWLHLANKLMQYCIEHFIDEESGMFYFTRDDEKSLITRKIEVIDNVIKSSNSTIATNLFKLGHYYYNSKYSKMAEQMLNNMVADIANSPSAYSNWLNLHLNYSSPYYEVVISGRDAAEKLKDIKGRYLPNILIAGSNTESQLPILDNKFNTDETFIYVCVERSCKLPVTEVKLALNQISR